jgi:hypothetical protein
MERITSRIAARRSSVSHYLAREQGFLIYSFLNRLSMGTMGFEPTWGLGYPVPGVTYSHAS